MAMQMSSVMGPAMPALRKASNASMESVSSTSSTSSSKGVQFSKFVKVSYTFGQEEYDRNPIEVDEMTSMDYYEFYQMQYQMYQTMKAEITLRQLGMLDVAMPNFDGEKVDRPEDYFLSSRTGTPTNLPAGTLPQAGAPHYQIHPDLNVTNTQFGQEQLSVY